MSFENIDASMRRQAGVGVEFKRRRWKRRRGEPYKHRFFSKTDLLLLFSTIFGPGITAKWGVIALKPMLLVISALLLEFGLVAVR